MQTVELIEELDVAAEDALPDDRGGWLGWLTAVLGVAVIVLAVWLAFGDEGSKELTPEQERMLTTISDYIDATNARDGAAAAGFMSWEGAYHDTGTRRFHVRNGELANYIDSLGSSQLVRTSAADGEATFVGTYVLTIDYSPPFAEMGEPSLYKMTTNGTKIVWHYTPSL